jgi:glucose-6-phosphate dehydrogenase assembly protein OpcA
MRTVSERARWKGEGLRGDQIAAELGRQHRELQAKGRAQALARTLNLIVAPTSAHAAKRVDEVLAQLGTHSPSRTLVLRRHGVERLDTEVVIDCEFPDVAGRVGICHDRVVLTADEGRLGHAASLLAPLLLSDLPTILWLPDPGAPIPDPDLLERAQQLLVDSTAGDGADFGKLHGLAARARIHDLAWGRLEFWRAATSAAFDCPERRVLLPRVTKLDVRYQGDALSAALLLVGWVVARAGWSPGRVETDHGRARGKATRPDGGEVSLSLSHDPKAHGCGGVEELSLGSDSDEVKVHRGAATSRLRDLFAEALQPIPSFAKGYPEALEAAAAMAGR